jgi:DNA-binding IclR family transcriptional regulator
MDLLAREGPMGVRAISKTLALPTGSTHRLLADLAEASVAERDADGDWVLSYRLLEITGHQLEGVELPRLARPFAERIASATQETVNVSALSDLEAICIDKVRGTAGMQLDNRIGSRGPLYAGGAGKAILAFLGEHEQRRVFDAPRTEFTSSTLVDAAELEAELGRVVARGYAIDDQEVVVGVYCVAMPIFDRSGHPTGALSVAGPSPKAPGADIAPVVEMLGHACEHISRQLGYTGPWPKPATASPRPAVAVAG